MGVQLEVEIETDMGPQTTIAEVVEITDDKVKFDMNHPLAGQELNFEVDYFSFFNSNTLEEIDEIETNTLLALAVNLGGVRLIDNFLIK